MHTMIEELIAIVGCPRVSLDTQLGDNVSRKECCLCPGIRTNRLLRSER